MKHPYLRVCLLVFMLPVIGACDDTTGTDTGNPFTQPLIVDARSSEPTDVEIRVDGGGILVSEVWLGIDEVGFEFDDACGSEVEVLTPALGVADHAEDEALRFPGLEVAECSYTHLSIPWILAISEPGVPAEVVGTSVYISGETAEGTPFVLRSTATGAIEATAVDGDFILSPDRDAGLLLGFDVAAWFDGVDLDSGIVGGGGSILVDESNNSGLLSAFEDNLPSGIELYLDQDEDGVVDGPDDELLASGGR